MMGEAALAAADHARVGSELTMGMDRPIDKAGRWPRRLILILIAAAVLAGAGYAVSTLDFGRSARVASERLTISAVTRGVFEDTIPLRGQVFPSRTVFLDAVEGGRVEEIHLEAGALVRAGDALVELSNTRLQLEVISREAQVAEQINNLRNTELAIEQNQLDYRRRLVDIDYQLVRLGRLLERRKTLRANDTVSRAAFQDTQDEHRYYTKLKTVTVEARDTDERIRKAQLAQLRESAARLEANLRIAQKNLDNLTVRAPIDGQLTALDVEIGQNVNQGQRIGQVDDPDDFKVTAFVDEFFLPRLALGQIARFDLAGRTYRLAVSKISPLVQNGQFEVDFVFDGDTPEGIRRGQTFSMQLELGAAEEAVLLPNGAFFQDTGGRWVFLLSSDGSFATRHEVRLGRRNTRFIEVLDGLTPGDRVITSSYAGYTDMDRIDLTAAAP